MHDKSLPVADRDDAPENGSAANGIIDYETVTAATKDLPENQRDTIREFHRHYFEHDLSLDQAAKLIYRDGSTLSQVFRNKYTAKLDNIVKEMAFFLDLGKRRAVGGQIDFVKTKLAEKIWQVCELAREMQKIAVILGNSHTGKTRSLTQFAFMQGRKVIYLRMPAGGGFTDFSYELACNLGVSPHLDVSPLRHGIMSRIDASRLLIIDEMHQCTPPSGLKARHLKCIEFVREIFDRTNCGGVLCATRVFADAMESTEMAKFFEQLKRRRLCIMNLPDRPTRDDLNQFSNSVGLPPSDGTAREIEAQMIEDDALGMWITLLRMGLKYAAGKKQQFDWSHVIAAHRGLNELEGKRS